MLGFKGMERRAVVLCVNEDGSRDRASERLYVGLSRPTDRLIVVGDPDAIRRMVAQRCAGSLACHSVTGRTRGDLGQIPTCPDELPERNRRVASPSWCQMGLRIPSRRLAPPPRQMNMGLVTTAVEVVTGGD